MPQLPTTYIETDEKNNNYNKRSNLYKYLNLTINQNLSHKIQLIVPPPLKTILISSQIDR